MLILRPIGAVTLSVLLLIFFQFKYFIFILPIIYWFLQYILIFIYLIITVKGGVDDETQENRLTDKNAEITSPEIENTAARIGNETI